MDVAKRDKAVAQDDDALMTDNIADRFSYLIAKIAWQLDAGAKSLLAASNLSPEQWRILALLDEQDGRSMSDLAQHAFVEAATLTKMMDRLVSDALVYRAPDARDRRRVLIFLATKAKDKIGSIKPVLLALDTRFMKRLGPLTVTALRAMSRDLEQTRETSDRTVSQIDRSPLLRTAGK